MKKRRWIICISGLLIVLLGVTFFIIRTIENKRIPYIVFMHNFDRAHCLYICSNGNIYASTSEESFVMDKSAVIERIRQNNYSDILEYVGTTDARKVQKMYRLFWNVVIEKEFYFERPIKQPLTEAHGGREQHWYGLYYNEDGEPVTRNFYISNVDGTCTDKRAYKIVDWMYECLKEYMKY